jgi:prolactin regulatory element-binding protein
VSVSFDSRARLTVIKQKGEKRRVYLWVAALLFVLVYVVLYYLMVAMGIIH